MSRKIMEWICAMLREASGLPYEDQKVKNAYKGVQHFKQGSTMSMRGL